MIDRTTLSGSFELVVTAGRLAPLRFTGCSIPRVDVGGHNETTVARRDVTDTP